MKKASKTTSSFRLSFFLARKLSFFFFHLPSMASSFALASNKDYELDDLVRLMATQAVGTYVLQTEKVSEATSTVTVTLLPTLQLVTARFVDLVRASCMRSKEGGVYDSSTRTLATWSHSEGSVTVTRLVAYNVSQVDADTVLLALQCLPPYARASSFSSIKS
jgi:hypothetical protein